MLMIALLVLCVLIVLGGLPSWGIHEYGYAPSGIGLVLVIVLLVILLGGRP
jgi:hypothetical protein